MSKFVYLLQHSSLIDNMLETKIIGVFSTIKEAEQALSDSKALNGFKDFQDDFYIDKYPLNKVFWKKGFYKEIFDV